MFANWSHALAENLLMVNTVSNGQYNGSDHMCYCWNVSQLNAINSK